MQKESNGRIRDFFTNELRQHKELVVMNPNRVSRIIDAKDRICENPVRRFIHREELAVIDYIRRKVVEQWPQRGVAKTIIIFAINFRVNEDWFDSESIFI